MKVKLTELREILVETFSSSQIPDNINELKINDFEEWDSLGNFTLLLAIEERFDTKFDLDDMAELNSIRSILRALE
jgi:acyl carrier protein